MSDMLSKTEQRDWYELLMGKLPENLLLIKDSKSDFCWDKVQMKQLNTLFVTVSKHLGLFKLLWLF